MPVTRWWILPLALMLATPILFVLPAAAAAPATQASSDGVPTFSARAPAAIHGIVVNCTSTITCTYTFNTSAGTGWANTTLSTSTDVMALQLPGEAKASYGLPYSTYIGSLIGTYTYWTVGTFVGTDINSGNVIYGTTDTNYTITCHGHSGRGGGCTYTYATDNGTIVVHFTRAEITSTSLACTPTFTSPGGRVTCWVNMTNGWNASNHPNGTVKISSGGTGSVSGKGNCVLSSGSCKFTYTPGDNTCGTAVLTATYSGNPYFYKSSATIDIDVYVSGGC